jgi:hypothetical protein
VVFLHAKLKGSCCCCVGCQLRLLRRRLLKTDKVFFSPHCDHVPSEVEISGCVTVFIIFKRQPFVPDLNNAWSEIIMQLLIKIKRNPCTCPIEMPKIIFFCCPLAFLFYSSSRWHHISKYYATCSLSCAA